MGIISYNQKMKLLAGVIAAASAGGHGDHSYPSTTSSPYPRTTTAYGHWDGHNMGGDKDDWQMGSGDYTDGDYMGDGHHGKPDMGHDYDRPDMSCNREAMKMWREEMQKWKYQQEEWQREFRMWKMENGGDYHGYDEYDHDKHDYDKPDYNDSHMGMGGDMGMGGWFDGWGMDMDMSWMDGIWEMLGQEDILCPMFGMIPFDPSWGVGTGADWEAGCRDNFRMQRQYEQLIMQAGGMKTKEFAEQWCNLMGEDAKKQLDMYGLGMYAGAAMPMCKCVTETVKDIVDGNMGMEMMANVGQCVGEVQAFVGMFMEMDVKVNIDMDLYSEENIQKAVEELVSGLGSLNVMDESILTLLRYWDMEGTFKKMGIFEPGADMDNIYSALAIVNIYNQNYEKDWTLEHYKNILENAADWVAYYDISRTIWTHIFIQQYADKMPDDKMPDDMEIEKHLIENFQKVYAAPTHIDEFFEKHEFDLANLAEKTQIVSGQPKEEVDFEQLMMDVLNSEHWEMGPYIALGQAYVEYLMDEKEPQFPGFLWGLLSCLDTQDVMMWSSSDNEDEVRQAWAQGIALKYSDTSSEFFMCMMPFNEMAVEWKSHSDMMSEMTSDMMSAMEDMMT